MLYVDDDIIMLVIKKEEKKQITNCNMHCNKLCLDCWRDRQRSCCRDIPKGVWWIRVI